MESMIEISPRLRSFEMTVTIKTRKMRNASSGFCVFVYCFFHHSFSRGKVSLPSAWRRIISFASWDSTIAGFPLKNIKGTSAYFSANTPVFCRICTSSGSACISISTMEWVVPILRVLKTIFFISENLRERLRQFALAEVKRRVPWENSKPVARLRNSGKNTRNPERESNQRRVNVMKSS